MGDVLFKVGVTLTPDPAGARLLGSIDRVARTWPTDLTITSGSDSHPPTDPHTLGRAFDLRTHDLADGGKRQLLDQILLDLCDGGADYPTAMPLPGIWLAMATAHWFGQVEEYQQPDEHLHVQSRHAAPLVDAPSEGTV